VNTNIQLLEEMAMLLEKYSGETIEVNEEQIYEIALAVRNIGTNYGSVSLL
jgi:hypothetical protein